MRPRLCYACRPAVDSGSLTFAGRKQRQSYILRRIQRSPEGMEVGDGSCNQ